MSYISEPWLYGCFDLIIERACYITPCLSPLDFWNIECHSILFQFRNIKFKKSKNQFDFKIEFQFSKIEAMHGFLYNKSTKALGLKDCFKLVCPWLNFLIHSCKSAFVLVPCKCSAILKNMSLGKNGNNRRYHFANSKSQFVNLDISSMILEYRYAHNLQV